MKKANRIVTPILCLVIFPIMYFLPIINVFVSSGLFKNDDGTYKNVLSSALGLRQYLSIKDIIAVAKGEGGNELLKTVIKTIKDTDAKDINIKELIPTIDWIYVFGVLAVILAVLLLVIIVFAAIGKFRKTNIALSAVALADLGGMYFCFNRFASAFLSGEVNVTSMLSSFGFDASSSLGGLSSLLGSLKGLVNSAVSFDAFELSAAFNFTAVIMAAVLVCSVASIIEEKK